MVLLSISPWGPLYRTFSNGKSLGRSSSPFVMRVFENEMDKIESNHEGFQEKNYVAVKRFHCEDVDLRYAINHRIIMLCLSDADLRYAISDVNGLFLNFIVY